MKIVNRRYLKEIGYYTDEGKKTIIYKEYYKMGLESPNFKFTIRIPLTKKGFHMEIKFIEEHKRNSEMFHDYVMYTSKKAWYYNKFRITPWIVNKNKENDLKAFDQVKGYWGYLTADEKSVTKITDLVSKDKNKYND